MGSHRDWPPLVIRPRRSLGLAVFTTATHLLAAAAIWPLPIGAGRCVLLLAVAASLVYLLHARVLGLAPWSIRAAAWLPDGSWRLTLVSGREITAGLLPSTFVSVPLVVLNFRHRWQWRSLVLTRDSIDPEQLRRLRQRLRVRGGMISSVEDGSAR